MTTLRDEEALVTCWCALGDGRGTGYLSDSGVAAMPRPCGRKPCGRTGPPGKTIGIHRKDGAERGVPWIEPGLHGPGLT